MDTFHTSTRFEDSRFYSATKTITIKSNIVKDNSTKHENKTTDNATPDKKVIKTDKETLETTGNPISVLLAMLMTIGITTIRRFKK